MAPPIIGITMDNRRDDPDLLESPMRYSRAVTLAGGVPVLLMQDAALAEHYVNLCDGFLLAGGDDVCMELLGRVTHPKALMEARTRQTFEWALLRSLQQTPDKPVMGVCLGMQHMSLFHGGDLHQHLPDVLGDEQASKHQGRSVHPVKLDPSATSIAGLSQAQSELLITLAGSPMNVISSHHQAVRDAGSLQVVAHASGDDVIEMVTIPQRHFYVGVQWHPELGDDAPCHLGLFKALVQAARAWKSK